MEKEPPRGVHQDDFQNIDRAENAVPNWAKDMESSRRYLLQAEIEYWHEMLRLNRNRVSKIREDEMRNCLKKALRVLNSSEAADFKIAA